MSTRFYLPASGTAGLTPATGGTWTNVASVVVRPMDTSKTNTARTTLAIAVDNSSGTASTLFAKFVSSTLSTQTISGTVKGQVIASLSSISGCTAVTRVGVYVVNSGGTVVATLLASTAGDLAITATLTNRKSPPSTSFSSYTCADNDRIVVEIGIIRTAGTTARTGNLRFGDSQSSDLTDADNTSTTDNNPYIEFSGSITFNDYTQENLLDYTEEFDNVIWTTTRASVTANATTAPDASSSTADKLVEDTTATNSHLIRQARTAQSETVCFSIYTKAAERTALELRLNSDNTTDQVTVLIDMSAGTISFNSTTGTDWTAPFYGIKADTNGYYRVHVGATKGIVDTGYSCRVIMYNAGSTYTGDGSSGFYVWGAQLNRGNRPATYTKAPVSPVSFIPRMMLMGIG